MAKLPLFAFIACSLAAQSVPTPASHFGHPIGVDRELLDWDKVVSYFNALARSSDKILVKELGKTAEGRPFIAATISSPATLRSLDHYRSIQQRLSDPRKTSDAEAETLFDQGKIVVLITCSIHATEVASTHSAVEFAYRLLTEDKPRFRAILDNTIFILVPSLNPDGVDIVTRWYRKTLGTPYEGTNPPELYHKYVGHDNNRDWYVFSQPETRHTISQLHNVWHPQIVYDVHQQGPFASRIFVPPWLDPVDPNIDAIIVQQCNSIGASMAADLTAAGKKGVAINALYDFWTASRHYQAYHGGLRILSESASARLASPQIVKPEQIQTTALGYNPREPSWNYLEPWEGGTWRLRDIIDYQLIALESCLYQAAIHRTDMLRNFYTVGKRAIARTAPYAFVIPKQQHDPGATKKMLELLKFGMVEIDSAGSAFEAGGKKYPAGSYVIRMQQPYSSYAKTLLERQHYPDLRMYPGGPPKRPYDVTTQTLPLLMGVRVDTIQRSFMAPLSPATEYAVDLDVRRPAAGVMAASDVDSWRAVNRLWSSGKQVWRD
ncbi:MAG: M14 family metallopeptidase, partial [Acidobacteriota bacterium]|nr:M14 family metallopeptidase [Acidobacteriota bacterium]